MKGKTGIICAGDQELAPFIPRIKECSSAHKAMLKFYSGKLEGLEIVTLFSGVCKTNAAVAAQILIDTYGCRRVINAGTAGGIDEKLKLFDTVISTEAASRHTFPGEIHFGRMISGEAFIEYKRRDAIKAAFLPLSVDMETAAIAHVCHVNNIPFLAVRTITDTAVHSGLETFDENCDEASHISADIVSALLHEIRAAL